MKKKFLLLYLLIITSFANAQNVGIGTTTPQATLDVRGSQRTGGINNYVQFDSSTGRIEWIGASLFTATSQQIIKHSASSEGLYAGGGKLDYRNSSGTPVFYSDWTNGNGYFSGKLGIGTVSPAAKLQITDGASGITPFFSARMVIETNSHTYINLLSPDPFETGILFGSGTNAVSGLISYNSTAAPKGFIFNNNGNQTRMVIDNGGNVGIGSITPSGYGHGGNNRIMEINNANTGSNIQSHLILSTNGTGGSAGGITWASQNVPGTEKRLAYIGNLYETSNAARIAFYTRNESGILGEKFTVLGNGNVGIGTATPNTPLSFPPALGKKITLYPGATGDVGFAVAGNRLQIYADNSAADVAIGYDAAGTFNERFAFKPTGALAINGNTGSAGQVLTSGGSGASQWTSSTNALYNNTNVINGTGSVTISPSGGLVTDLPGITYTLNATVNTKVLLSFNVPIHINGCFGCGASLFEIYFTDNNLVIPGFHWSMQNDIDFQLTGSYLLSFTPGTHTIRLAASVLAFGSSATITFGNTNPGPSLNVVNNMIIQVIPQ